MEIIEERIRELADPLVESEGMELIHVECVKMQSRWIIRLFLDKESGITIDDCAEISHQLGDILDVHDVPPGPYTLEISSPGPDRPLSRDKDFEKFRGRRIHLKLNEKVDGRKNFDGILVDYINETGEKTIIIDVGGNTLRIPRRRVAKANIRQDI